MTSLLEQLNVDREDYTDKGWDKYLKDLFEKLKDRDYYELMGVDSADMDMSLLTQNYKKLSLLLHPDKSAGKLYEASTSEIFKFVLNIYTVLKDPAQEQQYRIKQQSKNKSYNQTAVPQDFQKNNFSQDVFFGFQSSNFSGSNFNSGVFTSYRPDSRGSGKVIDGDVKPDESVKTACENITVNGNVYGTVESISGDIKIGGSVFGKVRNMSGNNTVEGFVSGEVRNISGDNIIGRGIQQSGLVETTSGDNKITGEVYGKYFTISGSTKINGSKVNSAKKHTIRTTYHY